MPWRWRSAGSKSQILEGYLNIVYFGQGAYGIGAAAERYFGETVDQLTLPQAALLAGLVQSPSAYDPIVNPKAALNRRSDARKGVVSVPKSGDLSEDDLLLAVLDAGAEEVFDLGDSASRSSPEAADLVAGAHRGGGRRDRVRLRRGPSSRR